MTENKELLTQLDSAAGDGDLGISMEQGFCAVVTFQKTCDEADVGILLMRTAAALNEASPSTLGTVLSVGIMAGGKAIKGKNPCGVDEMATFLAAGCEAIMIRSKSAPGEKTILDALIPAEQAVRRAADQDQSLSEALTAAAAAAAQGCEKTRSMIAVHGRAAYYAKKSIGLQDGGATVAKIIFETLAGLCAGQYSGKED
ncbi:MAG: dihydroxyacetone kinase subunit L [Acetanaerobacterium sp.]